MKIGKRLKESYKSFENSKLFSIEEAVKLVKSNSKAKFDETIDISMNLGVDPRQSDQMVRGIVALPSGTGKDVKVAVFAKNDKLKEASEGAGRVLLQRGCFVAFRGRADARARFRRGRERLESRAGLRGIWDSARADDLEARGRGGNGCAGRKNGIGPRRRAPREGKGVRVRGSRGR